MLPADLRLILAHKQGTSARLRFLRFCHGLCAFRALPAGSVLAPEDATGPAVAYHPGLWLREAERALGLDPGSLRPEPAFHATALTPDGPVSIHLAELTTVDPPFAQAAALGARFVAITEARDCAEVELELLRRAYAVLLG